MEKDRKIHDKVKEKLLEKVEGEKIIWRLFYEYNK